MFNRPPTNLFKLLGFALAILFSASQFGLAAEREIQWTEDYEAAVQRCATTNSILLLHFYTDNCPPCKLLDKKTFHDPNLVAAMNENVVPVRVNADKRRDLVQRYAVTRWPTDIYFFPNGDEIYRGVCDQDPAVYTQKIKRLALRNRDWTVERLAQAKAQQQRQDLALAANAPQIQTERPVYAGNAGRPVKTQSNSWNNGSAVTPSASNPNPSALASNNPNPMAGGKRVIQNPFAAEQPIEVPPASAIEPNKSAIVAAPIVAAPIVPATVASPQPAPPVANTSARPNSVPANPISSQRPAQSANANAPSQPYGPHFASAQPQPEPQPQPRLQTQASVQPQLPSQPQAQLQTQPQARTAASKASSPVVPDPTRRVYAETIGLEGYCPVTLIESINKPGSEGWVKGSPSFAVRHRGRIYYCASEQARRTLLSNPDQYTPCLSGFDLVHFCKTGTLIDGKCEFGRIQSKTDRVFLFDNAANCEAFEKDSEYYARLLDNANEERVANGSNETQVR